MAQVVDIDTIEVWPEGAEEFGISRSLTMAERDKIDDSDFAWPDAPDHPKYPINTQEHLDAAAKLIGRAPEDKQAAIKARAKRIAKRKGLKLPDSWTDESDDDNSDSKERLMRAANHEPMTGTHTHAHPAFGSQGDDDMHEHEHTHDNDADHKHSHEESTQDRAHTHTPTAITPESLSVYLPITRVDATSRTVTGQATVEKPDSYGTIFGYYPEAWLKWRGNMREQHDPKKAVGKALEVIPDDQERAIYVTSRVSRGAQDTWLKIEDGVLSGYSASIIPDAEFGNDPRRWPKKMYEGKEYPYLPRYTVAETSYVDNPATPGCNISLVRADGFLTDVVDVEEPALEQKQETQDRVGARVGSGTKSKMHESIGHTLQAAKSQMQNCDCPTCQDAIKILDPDDDGDIDLGGYDDPDDDWQSLYNNSNTADMERVVTELIERSLQPVYTRLQGIAGTLARSNASAAPMNIDQLITSTITRAFETFESRITEMPTKASLDEVRSSLEEVRGQVVKIAEQPMPGGPVLNASVMPRPIEKQLATDPQPQATPNNYGAVYQAIAEMSRSGQLDTTDKQIDAMTQALLAQRGGRR